MKWLSRQMLQCPCIALTKNQAEYERELRRLKIPKPWPTIVTPVGAHATTHLLDAPNGARVCIVGYTDNPNRIEMYGLLVHEAVHIFRDAMRVFRETEPGEEIEAYGIQHIAQQLMAEYDRQRKLK